MSILDNYQRLHPRSAQLYTQAIQSFPNGVTHDIRYLTPFPIYVDYAQGSRKWDVDGNELIDYVMGHGALFLGHGHPQVTKAIVEQAEKGTHYGACHELEIEWGQWVRRLIPSAEMVRFTSSGTEATMMAIRLARAFSGRDKILRFDYHFHGWHDSVVGARYGESVELRATGVPPSTLSNVVSIPANDINLVEQTLAEDGDIGAIILEPTGANAGMLPLKPGFLSQLRELTLARHVLLIFDEVVTGFRVSPGGAQRLYGVRPDLTSLAKILAGGLPGGALAGRADILSILEFRDDPAWNARQRMSHPGTFNANPLSAAAGVVTLSLIADGEMHAQADALTQQLVSGMNQVLAQRKAPGCAYGISSKFHLTLGKECPRPSDGIEWPWLESDGQPPPIMKREVALALRRGMLNHGVDMMGLNSFRVSTAHTEEDVAKTLTAFEATVAEMQEEGLL